MDGRGRQLIFGGFPFENLEVEDKDGIHHGHLQLGDHGEFGPSIRCRPFSAPTRLRLPTGLVGLGRVPLDKEKGVVKGEDILSGAEHRLLWTPREWDRSSGISPLHHFSGGSLHRAIDTTESTIMIFLCGHPAAESVRKWETPEVFSKALAPSSA
jgi:hypothetical protein